MKKSISFIHCADVHLNAPFSGLGKENFSRDRRRDLKETFEKIISLVQETNADYLVISGDLYEHRYTAASTISWLNGQFCRITDTSCILVPGNHDPYVSNSFYRSFQWNPNVHILTTKSPAFIDENNGAYFYGIGFDTFRQERLPLLEKPRISDALINVCLFHGTLDMAFTENAYNPVDSRTLTDMGFDYYALGHFHKRNESLASNGIINPGSPEPLGFDEQGEHGVYHVVLEKEEGRINRDIRFLPIQKRFYTELVVDVTGMDPIQLREKIRQLLLKSNSRQDIVRLRLSGRTAPGDHIDLAPMEQELGGLCRHLEFTDQTHPDYNIDELARENNITGVFVRIMMQKIAEAPDEEKKLLEKALFLGLDALIQGSIPENFAEGLRYEA